MEIQQHDGVVVEVAGSRQGFAKHYGGGGGVGEGEGCTRGRVWLPSHPPLYIGARERGAGPLQMDLEGGGQPRGEACPPSQGGAPFRVPPQP